MARRLEMAKVHAIKSLHEHGGRNVRSRRSWASIRKRWPATSPKTAPTQPKRLRSDDSNPAKAPSGPNTENRPTHLRDGSYQL